MQWNVSKNPIFLVHRSVLNIQVEVREVLSLLRREFLIFHNSCTRKCTECNLFLTKTYLLTCSTCYHMYTTFYKLLCKTTQKKLIKVGRETILLNCFVKIHPNVLRNYFIE